MSASHLSSRKTWSPNDLKHALASESRIADWLVKSDHFSRLERYFIHDRNAMAIDQDREVEGHSIEARVLVKKPDGFQGETSKRFFQDQPLHPQIEAAIATAMLSEQKPWTLPEPAEERMTLDLKTADPLVLEEPREALARATREITQAAITETAARFNSAELFVTLSSQELWTSRGFHERSSRSRVYAEAAFSSEKDEYLHTRWGVTLDELDIPGLFREAALRAKETGDLPAPQAGPTSVILDSDVLLTLMHDCLEQVSGYRPYLGLPHRAVGALFIDGVQGEPLTLSLNPHEAFGADTSAYSPLGEPQHPLTLIDRNRVTAHAQSAQYAQYLGRPVTTTRGDVNVALGKHSPEELRKLDARVLEILQFSGLFSDPNTGTYSSEIRLGRIHDRAKGTVTYVKGGSLSGNLFENLKDAHFSSARVKRASFSNGVKGYVGPSHVLMRGVRVVSA